MTPDLSDGPYVVAELSCNHGGLLDRALRLIDAAADGGADYVKLQCYTPDELVALRGDGPAPEPWDDMSMRDLYEKARTPHEWFPVLVAHAEEQGIGWFSSVFGEGSLAVLEGLGCPIYKIAAMEYDAVELRKAIRATGKPIIQSVREDQKAPWADVVLYCPPGYPQTAFSFASLTAYDGISYHGTDPVLPAQYLKAGAKMVEVHLQLEREPSGLERDVALNERQLRKLCEEAKTAALTRDPRVA